MNLLWALIVVQLYATCQLNTIVLQGLKRTCIVYKLKEGAGASLQHISCPARAAARCLRLKRLTCSVLYLMYLTSEVSVLGVCSLGIGASPEPLFSAKNKVPLVININ